MTQKVIQIEDRGEYNLFNPLNKLCIIAYIVKQG